MLFFGACKRFENAFFKELLVQCVCACVRVCVFWLAHGIKIADCIQESDQEKSLLLTSVL